jgi:glyoxylase-like metal-dependent hydrolase (beta-lactamase superfamily II)
MQAGGLDLPYDLVLLPGPNQLNSSVADSVPNQSWKKGDMFFVPDFVFLIEHVATRNTYLFDLGMRKDLERHSTPAVVANVLPNFKSYPASVVDILKKHGISSQQPEYIKAAIFSHLHFDHIGDFGKSGLDSAEIWVGPTACSAARPGYPLDAKGVVFSEDIGNPRRKIVEFTPPTSLLNEGRRRTFESAKSAGRYDGIDLREPVGGWSALGAFEAAGDIFGDGSMYVIDAPGHAIGHQMLLVRVKISPGGATTSEDDFILLSGDCFHHPAMLKDPLLTARPPYSKASMHGDSEQAIDTMFRARRCAEEENIWVVGAHDFSISDSVAPGKLAVEGLVLLHEWRSKGWKCQG